MLLDSAGWKREYEKRGALWIHDGNFRRPHALLTSGKHSSGFFNSGLVTEDPVLLDQAASDLVQLLVLAGLDINVVTRVVGPAMGAITLAHDLARHISFERETRCLSAFTEKDEVNGVKVMNLKRVSDLSLENILPVEDVLTTGGSVELTATAVTNAGGVLLPFVAVLVNRSGLTEVGGKKIVALIDRDMPMWDMPECPLCKRGSKPIRPKENENWSRLNASYP